MEIKDVMTAEYNWIAPNATISEAAKIMQDKDIGFLPVGENDRLIGTLTDRDIVVRSASKNQNPQTQQVKDVMTEKVYYCYDDQNVADICTNMSEIKVRRLPVVNRDKRLVGTVSIGDLAQGQVQESGQALQQITKA